jgi:hypothetical protein
MELLNQNINFNGTLRPDGHYFKIPITDNHFHVSTDKAISAGAYLFNRKYNSTGLFGNKDSLFLK